MKRLIFIVTILMAFSSQAQQYSTAIGLKGGFSFNGGGGINLKHFLGGSSAVEVSVGGGSRHIWLQGLYERNQELSHGVEWYYGFGGDIGLFTNGGYDSKYPSGLFLGADGVIGVEYTFEDFPLNLALDTGPTLRVIPYVGFGWGGGLAARYAF